MAKTVCIAGAGGVAGIGLTRCLKDSGFTISGYDGSVWGEQAMECPFVGDPYLSDLIIPVPDTLVRKYAGADNAFLPDPTVVELCQDKAKCAVVLGDLAPTLHWVRDVAGAGGAGAQMASEFLPGRNFSVEFVFHQGEPLGCFTKERLAYDIKGKKDPLWQRGSSVVSRCVGNKEVLDVAVKAVERVNGTRKLHGVFAVDLKENEQGVPKVTEINPGRFLTASYPYFEKFYNLPLMMVNACFGEKYRLGEYPDGWGVIRQQDSLPKWFSREQTKEWK